MRLSIPLFFLLTAFFACKSDPKHMAMPRTHLPPADNQLTDLEKSDGWKLLFDGTSLAGWHKYGNAPVGKMWVVSDNAIYLDAKRADGQWQTSDGGDILTNEDYENFDLMLQWKIDSCGNSGIIYHIVEDTAKYDYPWMTGPEMQVLDNDCHDDAKIKKHKAGDLYDLMECSQVVVKPHGQWNQVRLVSANGHVEHWLNNVKVVDIQMFEQGKPTQLWLDLIKTSKFPGLPAPAFGLSMKGKISLQDHGDKVWYKNIKLRKL